jgi:hypothetical protein
MSKIINIDELNQITEIESHTGFRVLEFGDSKLLDFTVENQSNKLKTLIYDALTDVLDRGAVRQHSGRYPLIWMSHHVDYIKQYFDDRDLLEDDEEDRSIDRLIELLETAKKEFQALFLNRQVHGVVELDDVVFLFPTGTKVVIQSRDPQGGIVKEIKIGYNPYSGSYIQVQLEVFHALGGQPAIGIKSYNLPGFDGLIQIAQLPIQERTTEMYDKLYARGQKFAEYSIPGSYVSCTGLLDQPSWYGSKTFRADGRVVIDSMSFKRIKSNAWRQIRNDSKISDDDDDDFNDEQNEVIGSTRFTEDEYWRATPYLYGFSLSVKEWGKFRVDDLKDITWREDSFDKLVLPADEKQMVRSLVEHHSSTDFQDIIEGKGGGCIFLFHGPPGEGKTVTAEAVAELLHRPLYSVSVGELGTKPTELEESLREILDVATIWNSVILLDEADIFMEARDTNDVHRNSCVGIFLKLLEYHNGVLILTTNRVKNIDTAFYSRISIALHFEKSDTAKREQVWTNLLGSAGLPIEWAKQLSEFELNGRQIKNMIRIAITMARSKNKEVEIFDFTGIVKLQQKFLKGLKD